MTRPRRVRILLRLAIALLALTGQSALACISAAGDEAGAAAHVERSGIAQHHAHNEATCVVCRVLSLHGRVHVASPIRATYTVGPDAPQSALAARPEQHNLPHNLSRAPPENA